MHRNKDTDKVELTKEEQEALQRIISEEKRDIASAEENIKQKDINIYEYITRNNLKQDYGKLTPYDKFDRKGIYLILNRPASHKYGKLIITLLYINILIALFNTAMMSVMDFELKHGATLYMIEWITSIIFIIELGFRYYSIGVSSHYQSFKDYVRFTFEARTLVDILAILPFVLMIFGFGAGNLQFLRILRILRVFKILEFGKFSRFDNILGNLFIEHKEALFVTYSGIFIFIFFISSVIYMIEQPIQPDVFTSIPITIYWALITFATIGYGDLYPVTPLGQFLTSGLSFLGVLAYAMPGAIVTAGLINIITNTDEAEARKRLHLKIVATKEELEKIGESKEQKDMLYDEYLKTHLLHYVDTMYEINKSLDKLEQHDKEMANELRISVMRNMEYTAFKFNNMILLRWLKDLHKKN